ncbi:hypothetical protein [Bradyrhizobium sp. McL0615]|uniref:hypothetical protein n=1 Tax=Bradyrhizobium sp. McL0615 TaxID=3415673 RepID=UPI003CF7405A
MSSFPADGAMEAICFFEPRNGSVFRYGPAAERLSSLPVFRHVTCGFDASNAAGRLSTRAASKKSMMRAAGVHLMWSGERGWEVSLAIADMHPAARPGQSRRVGRWVNRPDAFETTLLARYRREQGYGNQSQARGAVTCGVAAELVNASILDSNLCRIRLLPIGVRGRQHDECRISMTTEEDGDDDRQQQSCSERHRFSVVRVASIEYGH